MIGADFSKIFIVDTSADASATEFRTDTPKRFSSSDPDAVAALGTGLLADAVKGINAQLNTINRGGGRNSLACRGGCEYSGNGGCDC